MAVAVPLILIAAGAATEVVIATAFVMAASGANKSINRAASKVFGEDLVKVANIAGSIYMAFGAPGLAGSASGSAGASSGVDSAASSADYVNAMDAASDAVSAASAGGTTAAVDPVASMSSYAGAQPQGALAAARTAPPAAAPAAAPAAPPGAAQQPGALDKVGAAWKGMSPQAQGALIQVGGQVLGGYAQGKAAEEEAARREEENRRYRSGSGLRYWGRLPTYNRGNT